MEEDDEGPLTPLEQLLRPPEVAIESMYSLADEMLGPLRERGSGHGGAAMVSSGLGGQDGQGANGVKGRPEEPRARVGAGGGSEGRLEEPRARVGA
ncbi:hypothetical protein, partial [Streptacidiphilus carbonis]|uniref:hypothetical protein n=1 Tax=Streptacidiphilus carbonis TaxID=105422 RepID=UPI0005AB38E5